MVNWPDLTFGPVSQRNAPYVKVVEKVDEELPRRLREPAWADPQEMKKWHEARAVWG